MAYDKIKPTTHFTNNFSRPGHDVSLEQAEAVVCDPAKSEIEENGRIRYWRAQPGFSHPLRVVVDSDISANVTVARVVTAFVDSDSS